MPLIGDGRVGYWGITLTVWYNQPDCDMQYGWKEARLEHRKPLKMSQMFPYQACSFSTPCVYILSFLFYFLRLGLRSTFSVKSCHTISASVQFSSVTQSCPTLCDPMNQSTPGLPVHHQLPEFTQTQVHRVRDAIQPSHPLSPPFPPAPNPSQHQSLFQWVNSSHEVAKVLEFQL